MNVVDYFGIATGSVDGVASVQEAYTKLQKNPNDPVLQAAYNSAYANAVATEYSLVPGVGAAFAARAASLDTALIMAEVKAGQDVSASDIIALASNLALVVAQGVTLIGLGEVEVPLAGLTFTADEIGTAVGGILTAAGATADSETIYSYVTEAIRSIGLSANESGSYGITPGFDSILSFDNSILTFSSSSISFSNGQIYVPIVDQSGNITGFSIQTATDTYSYADGSTGYAFNSSGTLTLLTGGSSLAGLPPSPTGATAIGQWNIPSGATSYSIVQYSDGTFGTISIGQNGGVSVSTSNVGAPSLGLFNEVVTTDQSNQISAVLSGIGAVDNVSSASVTLASGAQGAIVGGGNMVTENAGSSVTVSSADRNVIEVVATGQEFFISDGSIAALGNSEVVGAGASDTFSLNISGSLSVKVMNSSGIITDNDTFSSAGALTQDQQFSDGTLSDTINYTNGVQTSEDFYNQAGQETASTQFNTDGSSTDKFYDPSSGALSGENLVNADGSQTNLTINSDGSQTAILLNASGQVVEQVQFNTNGSQGVQSFDPSTGVLTGESTVSASGSQPGYVINSDGSLTSTGELVSASLVAQEANAAFASGDTAGGNALISTWASGFADGTAGAQLAADMMGSGLASTYLTGAAGAIMANGLTMLASLGIRTGSAQGGANASFESLIGAMESLFQGAIQAVDPLELDLTGNGVQTVGQSNGVYFDYTGRGFAVSTGWAATQDGLLVLPDANGGVTQGSELFGNYTVLPDGSLAANGFQALAALDSNGDGVIDAGDPVFSELRIWVGGDGQPGSGELLTLAQAGIQSLNLNYSMDDVTDPNGNRIEEFGSYTLTNGTTLAMDDVAFSVNATQTVALSAPAAVSAAIAALPNLDGAGDVYSLQQAMARDGSGRLEGLVQAFVAGADTMTLAQARSTAEAILLDWTGADQYSTTSRGPYIDGQEVYVVEAFMGQDFSQQVDIHGGNSEPGLNAAAQLQQAYGMLLDWTTMQLLGQTRFATWLDEVGMSWNASTNSLSPDVSQLVSTLSVLYAGDPTNEAVMMNEFARYLEGAGGTDSEVLTALRLQGSLAGSGFSLALAAMGYVTVTGNAATPVINGVLDEDSALLGVAGETLVAGNGNDLLVAGGGAEVLTGGSGTDTFVFNRGSGQALINDPDGIKAASSNQDVVQLGAGFTPAGTTV
uniref:hypothetical protein n=1 Tax=Paraburkholderia heleia TaxID=634127 RepID=UPI0038B8736D